MGERTFFRKPQFYNFRNLNNLWCCATLLSDKSCASCNIYSPPGHLWRNIWNRTNQGQYFEAESVCSIYSFLIYSFYIACCREPFCSRGSWNVPPSNMPRFSSTLDTLQPLRRLIERSGILLLYWRTLSLKHARWQWSRHALAPRGRWTWWLKLSFSSRCSALSCTSSFHSFPPPFPPFPFPPSSALSPWLI